MRHASIRPARLRDVDAIARVHVDSWRSTYRGLVPESYLASLDVADRARMWADILARRDSIVLVAEDRHDGIVGFASGGASRWAGMPFDAELYAIYLLDAAQRQGVGERLFDALVERLVGAGFRSMVLWVLAKNAPACRFYERMGGVPAGTREEELGGTFLAERAYGWTGLRER